MTEYLKDPNASLRYAVDWTANYLLTDSIAASTWTVAPIESGGLSVVATSIDANVTDIHVAGGLPGHIYRVANRITLAGGETEEREILIRIGDR